LRDYHRPCNRAVRAESTAALVDTFIVPRIEQQSRGWTNVGAACACNTHLSGLLQCNADSRLVLAFEFVTRNSRLIADENADAAFLAQAIRADDKICPRSDAG